MVLKQKRITEAYAEVKAQPAKRKILVDENTEEKEGEEFLSIVKAGTTETGDSEADAFYLAKKALHTSKPSKLPRREAQVEEVYNFLSQHLAEKRGGSLYISGAPGTGKTAVVQHVLGLLSCGEKGCPFIHGFVNCMNLTNPTFVFEHVCNQLKVAKAADLDPKERLLKRITSKTARMIVLVLDEMDHLLSQSRANEVLYTIFQWTRVPNSKLILIGVANALDLTVRHLPMLTNSPKPKPSTPKARARGGSSSGSLKKAESESTCQLMNFPPYEREDIASILEDRLSIAGNASDIFDPAAIKFVAGKVAASTGDMRKALNACKTALDTMEKQQRQVLKTTADDGFNSSSPKKYCKGSVGVLGVFKAMAPQKDEGGLPTQQQLILATLLRIHRNAPNSKNLPFDGIKSAVPLAALYDEYRKICSDKGFSWIDRSEMSSVCGMLEDRSLLSLTQGAGTPSSSSKRGTGTKSKNKAGLFFDPVAAEIALRTGDFLKSIVQA